MESQAQQVLARLKKGPLTPLEALNELGVMCLPERVRDLRKEGHNISTTMISVVNRHNQKCRVGQYRLEKKKRNT